MSLTFEQLVARLFDASAKIASADVRLLSALPPEQLQALSGAWKHIALPRRRTVIQMVAELAEDNVDLDFNPVFKMAVHDADDDVRCRAVEGLWEDEEVATADLLVNVLRDDPVPGVRAAAASVLGHFVYRLELDELDRGTGERIKLALYGVIENAAEPIEVRRRALESLAYLSEDRAREAIGRAYADEASKLRSSAIFAMGRSCDRRWLPAVLRELQSANAEFRFEAARASGQLDDQRAVPVLIKMIGDKDREVRIAAIGALGELGGDGAKNILRKLIVGADVELASAADAALAELEINEDPLRMTSSQFNQN